MKGWVKMYRQLLQNPIARKPKYCHVWVHLLLMAAHQQTDFIWNNKRQRLEPGQLLTGRIELSKQCGIPESSIQRILKYLESEHQIEQQTFTKFRIITIKNWDIFQGSNESEQQANNRWTADEQQMDTYKNVNNVKNVKKTKGVFIKPSGDEVSEYAKGIGYQLDGAEFVDYYESKGWMIGRNPMKDWRAAVRTWKQRAAKPGGKIYRNDTEYKGAESYENAIEL